MEQNHYIEILKAEVLIHFGRTLDAPTDYDLLSVAIEKSTGEVISVSTLKRLFGYKGQSTIPRPSTLSVLARYVGTTGWSDFCKRIDAQLADEVNNNPPRRKRWPIVVAVVAALLVVTVVVWLVVDRSSKDVASTQASLPAVEEVEQIESADKQPDKIQSKPKLMRDVEVVEKKAVEKKVVEKKAVEKVQPNKDSIVLSQPFVAKESLLQEQNQEQLLLPNKLPRLSREELSHKQSQEKNQEKPSQELSQEQRRQSILNEALQRSMAMCARVRKLYGTMPILEYRKEIEREYFPFVFDTLRPYVAKRCQEEFDPVTAAQYSSEISMICQDLCADLNREISNEVGEALAKGHYIR